MLTVSSFPESSARKLEDDSSLHGTLSKPFSSVASQQDKLMLQQPNKMKHGLKSTCSVLDEATPPETTHSKHPDILINTCTIPCQDDIDNTLPDLCADATSPESPEEDIEGEQARFLMPHYGTCRQAEIRKILSYRDHQDRLGYKRMLISFSESKWDDIPIGPRHFTLKRNIDSTDSHHHKKLKTDNNDELDTSDIPIEKHIDDDFEKQQEQRRGQLGRRYYSARRDISASYLSASRHSLLFQYHSRITFLRDRLQTMYQSLRPGHMSNEPKTTKEAGPSEESLEPSSFPIVDPNTLCMIQSLEMNLFRLVKKKFAVEQVLAEDGDES